MYLTERIELIGGKVVVAGNAAGAFQLLRLLLESWTAHAALGFVSGDFTPWITALADQYRLCEEDIEERIAADPLKPLPGKLNFTQIIPDEWMPIRRMLTNLLMSANQSNLRFAGGPGFAVKIGEDAPTPDFVIAQSHADLRFSERHLDGVPEIVIEMVAPDKDIFQLQQLYASHGIPEMWLVDLKKREFVVLQNRGGYYRPVSLLTGGVYHSVAVAGLVININLLWDVDLSPEDMLGAVLLDETGKKYNSILNYARMPNHRTRVEKRAFIRPGQIPFEPCIEYFPGRLTCEEFISWAPEPGFELDGNRLLVSSRTGSRNILGMLLQCIGLKAAVALLPLKDWITAIAERRLQIASRIYILKSFAREAQRTAQILREEFGRHDLRTFGWLDQPPGMWTSVKIVDMKPENGGPPHQEIRCSLRKRCIDGIEYIGFDSLTPADKRLFAKHSLTL